MKGGRASEDGFEVRGGCVGNGVAMGRDVSDGVVTIRSVIVIETVFECFCERVVRRDGEECGVWRDWAFGFGEGGCGVGSKLMAAFFKVGYFTFIL